MKTNRNEAEIGYFPKAWKDLIVFSWKSWRTIISVVPRITRGLHVSIQNIPSVHFQSHDLPLSPRSKALCISDSHMYGNTCVFAVQPYFLPV